MSDSECLDVLHNADDIAVSTLDLSALPFCPTFLYSQVIALISCAAFLSSPSLSLFRSLPVQSKILITKTQGSQDCLGDVEPYF